MKIYTYEHSTCKCWVWMSCSSQTKSLKDKLLKMETESILLKIEIGMSVCIRNTHTSIAQSCYNALPETERQHCLFAVCLSVHVWECLSYSTYSTLGMCLCFCCLVRLSAYYLYALNILCRWKFLRLAAVNPVPFPLPSGLSRVFGKLLNKWLLYFSVTLLLRLFM